MCSYVLQTILGNGIDCHLLALKQIALECGHREPSLFADPVYREANQFRLSTSQVPTTMDAFMCYGAVVPDGYGVSYNPHAESIVFCIARFASSRVTLASERFALHIESALDAMAELCVRAACVAHDALPERSARSTRACCQHNGDI